MDEKARRICGDRVDDVVRAGVEFSPMPHQEDGPLFEAMIQPGRARGASPVAFVTIRFSLVTIFEKGLSLKAFLTASPV